MLLNRLKNTRRPYYCRVKEILLGIRCIKVERRCGVDDEFEGWLGLNCFIECTWLGNVLDDHEIELVLRYIWMGVEYFLALLGRANRGNDGVAAFEEHVKDMCSDKTAAACE